MEYFSANRILPFLVFGLSFLIGSIPFGLLIARAFKVQDLREKGSGNIGATNVSRVVGFWPAGFMTFALDVGKGALCVFLTSPLALRGWGELLRNSHLDLSPFQIWATGFFVVLGHCYSPWLKFNGGKGVATGFGALMVLAPISALAGLIGFILVFLQSRIASLASISGLLIAAVSYLVLNPFGPQIWAGAAMIFIILLRHESNIDALLEGRENAFR